MCGTSHSVITAEYARATPFGPYGIPIKYDVMQRGEMTNAIAKLRFCKPILNSSHAEGLMIPNIRTVGAKSLNTLAASDHCGPRATQMISSENAAKKSVAGAVIVTLAEKIFRK